MKRSYGLRAALLAVLTAGTCLVAAAPAAAETVIVQCSGTCGYYEVHDSNSEPGARCDYQNGGSFKLLDINVRPPLMHGNYHATTKVGWSFRIQRQSNSLGPWSTFAAGPTQTATANDAIPAYQGNGFTRQTWSAPNNPNGYRYRVRIVMYWWRAGAVEGRAVVEDDVYLSVRGSSHHLDSERCLQSY
jgi:hypothetical protein